MKKHLFKTLAYLNKLCLPSFTKQQLDLSKASKIQLLIIQWRFFHYKKYVIKVFFKILNFIFKIKLI